MADDDGTEWCGELVSPQGPLVMIEVPRGGPAAGGSVSPDRLKKVMAELMAKPKPRYLWITAEGFFEKLPSRIRPSFCIPYSARDSNRLGAAQFVKPE